MTQTLSTKALNMLVARAEEEILRRAKSLVDGSAESFDDYRQRSGFIQGLKHAIQLCDAVETDLYKGAK